MAVLTKQDLTSRNAKLYRTALEALEKKNYGYAVVLFRDILAKQPEILEVRERMRKAQLDAIGGKPNFFRNVAALVVCLPHVLKVNSQLKEKQYDEALDTAERAMTFAPTASVCYNLVEKAASAAGMPEIAASTLGFAAQFEPKNIHLLYKLAQAYSDADQGTKALATVDQIIALDPNNRAWDDLRRRASAKAAMDKDGWTETERDPEKEAGFQDLIRDKERAAELEQEGRTTRTAEGRAMLIERQEKLCEEQPVEANFRQLADYYLEDERWQQAIDTFERVFQLSGVRDPAMEHKIVNARCAMIDQQIAELKDAGADDPACQQRITELEEEKDRVRIENLEHRVRRNPSSHEDRFALAEVYYARGNIDDALGHFQFAQRSPRFKTQATLLTARCFMQKRLFDLAEEQTRQVIDSIEDMTSVKKEALYVLGEIYRAAERHDDAMACFKQIYAVDARFRDVRSIVEGAAG